MGSEFQDENTNKSKKTIIAVIIAIVAVLVIVLAAYATFFKTDSTSKTIDTDESVTTDGGEDGSAGDLDGLDGNTIEAAKQVTELGESWNSYTVQINGKVLALPCTYEDLASTGFTFKESAAEDGSDTVASQQYGLGVVEDANGNTITIDFLNPSNSEKKMTECLVGGVLIDTNGISNEEKVEITFPGNVKLHSLKDDVLKAYGTPDDSYEEDGAYTAEWLDADNNYSYLDASFNGTSKELTMVMMKGYGF